MTPTQLKKLAHQILDNEVFGTWDIRPGDFDTYVHLIFLPLAMGAKPPSGRAAAFAPYKDKIQTNASPGGYPCFSSVQFISEDDYTKLVEILEAAEAAKKQAIEEVDE